MGETTKSFVEILQLSLSIYWFVIGILVGVCGNLATSGILELLKIHYPESWPTMIFVVSIVAGSPVLYFTYKWFSIFREIQSYLRRQAKELGIELSKSVKDVLRERESQ